MAGYYSGLESRLGQCISRKRSLKSAYTKQSHTKHPIQNSSKNHEMKEKQSNTKQSGLRSQVGALRARRSFAAITGSKFRIKSYPLLASSQHVGAAAAITCSLCLLNKGQFSAYRLVKTIITWEYFYIIGLEKWQYAAVFEMDSIGAEHEFSVTSNIGQYLSNSVFCSDHRKGSDQEYNSLSKQHLSAKNLTSSKLN